MKVIDQRVLARNHRELEAHEPGDTLRVKGRNGEIIELGPRADGRPWTTKELVERYKLLPRVDFAEMRADIDELFGVERIDEDPWERRRD